MLHPHSIYIPEVCTCERWVECNISIHHEPSNAGLAKGNKNCNENPILGFSIFQPVKHFQLVMLLFALPPPQTISALEIHNTYVRRTYEYYANCRYRRQNWSFFIWNAIITCSEIMMVINFFPLCRLYITSRWIIINGAKTAQCTSKEESEKNLLKKPPKLNISGNTSTAFPFFFGNAIMIFGELDATLFSGVLMLSFTNTHTLPYPYTYILSA